VSSGGNSLTVGSSGNDQIRPGSKRARRRNDTTNVNTDQITNDPNSANEGGNASVNSSLNQKKNISSNQGVVSTGSGSGSGLGNSSSSTGTGGKKKKRKTRGANVNANQMNVKEDTPPPETIDPDEPTYCVCNQVTNSYPLVECIYKLKIFIYFTDIVR